MPPKRTTRPGKITVDEQRFVDEYLIDRNGTAAYIRANPGTSKATAGEMASRLLKKSKVQTYVKAGSLELQRACKTSAVKEVRGLALLANYDIGAAFDLTVDNWVALPPRKIPYETRKAMTAIKYKRRSEQSADGTVTVTYEDVEYKFADKLAARDKLMRHLGLYKDMPPLEVLLALLPSELREPVRQSLAASLLAGGSGDGNQGHRSAGNDSRQSDAPSTASGPDAAVPGSEDDPGSVAGGIPLFDE